MNSIKIFLIVFREKNSFGGNFIFLVYFVLFDWAWSKLSQGFVTVGSLNSQDMISQVNIYVMGIIWILCDVYMWR